MALRASPFLMSVVAILFLGTAAALTIAYQQQQNQKRRKNDSDITLQVTTLNRCAVKGLGADDLEEVELTTSSFPDDRRYALWQTTQQPWKEDEWLHKENFLCAFTHPQLLSQFTTSFCSGHLVLKQRATGRVLLGGPVDLESHKGRSVLAQYLSQQAGVPVQCISSQDGDFHFGNTRTGTALNNDRKARCMHIVFQSTVDALAAKIGKASLNPTRFRPNIVLQGSMAPFQELQWIGKLLVNDKRGGAKLRIINKTVRCDGVGVDPLDDSNPKEQLDIPALLMQHFPEHGPYLGVYCVLEESGTLSKGDTLKLID